MVPPNVTCTNAIKVLRSHLKTVLKKQLQQQQQQRFIGIPI